MSVAEVIDEVLARPQTRKLTSGDLARLDTPLGSEASPVVRITHRHHMLARLLAQGTPDVEASFITGHSQSRISILKKDPAFKDLIAYYGTQVNELYLDVHQRLATLGLSSVDELAARLEEKPESFTNRELMELSELALDRSGFGPSQTINGSVALLTPEIISSIKAEASRRAVGQIKALPQSHQPASVGEIIDLTVAKDEATEGSQDQRSDLSAQGGALPQEELP